ncbi:hypothetical protein WMF36_09725 [Sorangium sp. So ce887]
MILEDHVRRPVAVGVAVHDRRDPALAHERSAGVPVVGDAGHQLDDDLRRARRGDLLGRRPLGAAGRDPAGLVSPEADGRAHFTHRGQRALVDRDQRDAPDRRAQVRDQQVERRVGDLLVHDVADEAGRVVAGLEHHAAARAVRGRQHPARPDQRARAQAAAGQDLSDGGKDGLDLAALDRLRRARDVLGIRRLAISDAIDADRRTQNNAKRNTEMS